MELKDEVLISEILEAIFKEMRDLLSEYKIPNDARDELKQTLSKRMEELISAYNGDDIVTLYNALKGIRYDTTYRQLNAWQKYPERHPEEFGGFRQR